MAKPNQRDPISDVGPDLVTINLPDPTTFPTPNFTVSGTANPTNATVSGILTDTTSGATFASDPPSVLCTGTNGDWTLDFQGIPPGSYILGVNEQPPAEGADAKNVVVTSPVSLTIDPIVTTKTTATVTVTNNSLIPVTVSAVISMSPAKHGKTKHKPIGARKKFDFEFDGLTPNKDFTATAYPIKGLAKGDNKKGKTKSV